MKIEFRTLKFTFKYMHPLRFKSYRSFCIQIDNYHGSNTIGLAIQKSQNQKPMCVYSKSQFNY